MSGTDLVAYYAQRAPEYEDIYEKAERQADLARLKTLVREKFSGLSVLEVACGTGYWTQILAETAATVIAADINEEVLAMARAKPRIANNPKVQLARVDAFTLVGVPQVEGCLMAFWWSHIAKERMAGFLRVVHSTVGPGTKVLVMDNRYVPDSSRKVCRTDRAGNSYQLRTLADGSEHEVLKNFPNETELMEAVAPFTANATVQLLEYYWILQYETRR